MTNTFGITEGIDIKIGIDKTFLPARCIRKQPYLGRYLYYLELNNEEYGLRLIADEDIASAEKTCFTLKDYVKLNGIRKSKRN